MKNLFVRMCARPSGTLILRLTLGGIFVFHGVTKLANMIPVIPKFLELGFSPTIAWIVAIVEVVAGALVLVGIRVRIASLGLAIIMAASIFVFANQGMNFYAMELNVVLLGLALGMTTIGCGRYSVCSVTGGKACGECEKGHNHGDNCKHCTDGVCPIGEECKKCKDGVCEHLYNCKDCGKGDCECVKIDK